MEDNYFTGDSKHGYHNGQNNKTPTRKNEYIFYRGRLMCFLFPDIKLEP